MLLVPGAWGLNAVLTEVTFPEKVTGLVVIVPALVLELVTSTSAWSPPRRGWLTDRFNVTGSSRAAAICTLVLAAVAAVVKLPGELIKIGRASCRERG